MDPEVGALEPVRAIERLAPSAARMPRSGWLLAPLSNGAVEVWDLDADRRLARLEASEGNRVESAVLSPRGRWLARGRLDAPGIDLVRVTQGGALRLAVPTVYERPLAFAPGEDRLVTGPSLVGRPGSPMGRRLPSEARLWEPDTGELVAVLEEHVGPVWAATFAAKGRTLLTASESGVQLWDAKTGARKGRLLRFEGGIGVVTAEDGRVSVPEQRVEGGPAPGLSWTDGAAVRGVGEVGPPYVDNGLLAAWLLR